VTLTGFYPARVLERMGADEIRSMRAEMLEALDAEPPDAPIAGVYPFDEVRAALAHAAAEGAAREGKIILVP
jgi:NADPH:quinone reductase-like Zn-dependent oxidoreductase